MALDLLYSWILAQREHCRRGLLTDDVAASFLQFLMSPDDADTKRSIKRPPLITSVSAPLLDQRAYSSPTKKSTQLPFQYCKSPSTNASFFLPSTNAPMLSFPLSHPCRPRGGGLREAKTADEALLSRISHRQSRLS